MSSSRALSSVQPFGRTGTLGAVSGHSSIKSFTPSSSVSFCDKLQPSSSTDKSGLEEGHRSYGSFTPSPSVSDSF